MPDQPEITDAILYAATCAYEARDEYAGEQYAHDGIRAALTAAGPFIAAQVLREAADHVDRGPTFPMPSSIISALLREKADDYAKETDRA